ncbi:EF2563 family selenium-dependent molybdenum hydroxylase system protein [Acidaminobacter sp. JC074]|uniref:selenium-dependent molybdenum cofactor biosynthesis protein YqeB n=1 Tax=Acidaminobacter sp. JC074 TaxID=2530199 RepID=UPI001F0CFDEF|nr:selenium-dependent molybdenum cofactor biosynthesis protein YqeB [Acidaminobacter sp. JC074]MCH4887800.1 EF2563 family selenium-dependent molybdenum hydroxylase system protein [Acidaminobacter sp. JC074]
MKYKVLVRGGGDLASAVIQKFYRTGFNLVVSELPTPIVVRRTVSFCNAVYEGTFSVEGIKAVHIESCDEIDKCHQEGSIPVLTVDEALIKEAFQPHIFVDATLSKKQVDYHIGDYQIMIGLGPEIEAGVNVDTVIETCRGHDLGRLITNGFAKKNTSIPGFIDGYAKERVLRAPCSGKVESKYEIGDSVSKGDRIMTIDGQPVYAKIDGIIRGLIHPSITATKGLKVGDVDPRGKLDYCYSISDKGRNIAGAVLEAVMILLERKPYEG